MCQIAKVRVCINFGWVSLFTRKYLKCDFFGHMRIDIKSDYQFYTFFRFVSMCAYTLRFPGLYSPAVLCRRHPQRKWEIRSWIYTTINRTMVSSAGGSLIGDAAGEERVGRTFTCHFGRQFERRKKNRESDGRRGLGFRWLLLDGGEATTNQNSAEIMGYIFGRRRAGRWR